MEVAMVVDTPTSSGHRFFQISASYTQVAKMRQASSPNTVVMDIAYSTSFGCRSGSH